MHDLSIWVCLALFAAAVTTFGRVLEKRVGTPRGERRVFYGASSRRWHTQWSILLLVAGCGGAGGWGGDARERREAQLGAAVYAAHCALCHGAQGEGSADWRNRRADGRLPPPPHDSTGHTWHHADGLLFRIVSSGTATAIGDTAHRERYGMPALSPPLTPAEIRAVLTYLKRRWTKEQRQRQATLSIEDPFLPEAPLYRK